MRYKVVFTYQAESEANAAYQWIAKDAPSNAFDWFEGLIQAIETLGSMPDRCAVAPESEDVGQEIRHLIYGRYRVLFAIGDQTVLVLHIRHGAQKYLSRENF
jgi:plasmid stabilization system protein ParE